MTEIKLSPKEQLEIDKEVIDAIGSGEFGDDMLVEIDGSKATVEVDDEGIETVEEQEQILDISDEVEVEEETVDEDEEVLEDEEVVEEDLLDDEGIEKDVKLKKKLTPKEQLKKMQGLAETRLNAFNKVNDSDELKLGQLAASNPALVKLIQAVNIGLIDPDTLLQGGAKGLVQPQGVVEPLQQPVMPVKPEDYNREDLADLNSSSSRFEAAKSKYFEDSIIFLTNSQANSQAVNDQNNAIKLKADQRDAYKNQLVQLYALSDLEVDEFMARFDGEGKISTDNLMSIFRAEQSGMTREERIAAQKADDLRNKKKVRKARGPGAITSGDKTVVRKGEKDENTLINAEDLSKEELDKIKYIDM